MGVVRVVFLAVLLGLCWKTPCTEGIILFYATFPVTRGNFGRGQIRTFMRNFVEPYRYLVSMVQLAIFSSNFVGRMTPSLALLF